jgi:hypothetical protein
MLQGVKEAAYTEFPNRLCHKHVGPSMFMEPMDIFAYCDIPVTFIDFVDSAPS